MWTADAIEKIRDIVRDSTEAELFEEVIPGVVLADRPLHVIAPPSMEPVAVNTLTGLCDLIRNEKDFLERNGLCVTVLVQSPDSVSVLTGIRGDRRREKPFLAEANIEPFRFGTFIDPESFIIGLRSQFVQNEDSDYLLKLLQRIQGSKAVTALDNGITQQIETKSGVVLMGNEKTRPILTLAPYRTFIEIKQPESEFLLRINDGMNVALFEADGAAWRNEAMLRIRAYLTEAIGNLDHVAAVVA